MQLLAPGGISVRRIQICERITKELKNDHLLSEHRVQSLPTRALSLFASKSSYSPSSSADITEEINFILSALVGRPHTLFCCAYEKWLSSYIITTG